MIGFRVDANEKVATGHLMRCIAIAEMCRRKGEECLFILAEEKETERLRKRNFPYDILHSDWADMSGEKEKMEKLIEEKAFSFLLVDSYKATTEYLRHLNSRVPVMYIDDFGKTKIPVSAVLHYGIGAEEKNYQREYEQDGVKVLMGMEYIPLREEFMEKEIPHQKREKSILVTTGGTDTYHITGKFLEQCFSELEKNGTSFLKDYQYEVIVGALNSHIHELEAFALEHPEVRIHKNVSNMSEYMRKCKMAISAGGTTLYELCACGIPTVCFSFADNQKPGTAAFGKSGLMDYVGDARETDVVKNMLSSLQRLHENETVYKERQEKMQKAVAGKGAWRIATFLCTP